MTDLESSGDAATGAVVARAVEPGAGEVDDGHTHESHCLNCDAELVGDFCHECGQRAHVHRSLKGFFHDLMHGALHFEGKIWRTLPKLVGNPGDLTRRYIDGERARFISPIALFLFSVFLMFAVLSLAGPTLNSSNAEMRAGISEQVAQDKAELARLEADRARAAAAGTSTAALDNEIRETREEVEMLELMRDRGISSAAFSRAPNIEPGNSWLENAYLKAKQNPDLLIYKLKTNAYKFSWALIPLSVPFMWLLFPFSRRFRLYDHTVFVTYSLSFMTLLIITALLVGAAGLGTIASLAFVVPPIHMYLQLKGTYGLSRLGALWRTLLLVTFAFMAMTFFALLLLTLGALD
ncbi:DUF3667 domain-containing protein [Sphingomonas sp.]|uniref:DUF3667 domain-containing protein n=1 Tax=Sphingomonas sp. TaxID=28214 RepID=UPI0017C5D298|nr:DUF3667 domain-containing protein [Sphingomonas sp.]MBA3512347.1 DUF3667 domain-containing protein [Sphingomonas sp.]